MKDQDQDQQKLWNYVLLFCLQPVDGAKNNGKSHSQDQEQDSKAGNRVVVLALHQSRNLNAFYSQPPLPELSLMSLCLSQMLAGLENPDTGKNI